MSLLGGKIKGPTGSGDSESRDLWIVSYADMMTLLLGFFIILYSLTKVDEKKFATVSKQIAGSFKGEARTTLPPSQIEEIRQIHAFHTLVDMAKLPGGVDEAVQRIEKAAADADSVEAAGKKLLMELDPEKSTALKSLEGQVLSNPERLEIALPDSVLFVSGTAKLTPLAKKAIGEVAVAVAQVQNLVFVEVSGHTDSVPLAPNSLFPNNWALSAARAGAVTGELIRFGVDPKKLSARGLADLQPLFPEKDPQGGVLKENREKNRRVQISLVRGYHDHEK